MNMERADVGLVLGDGRGLGGSVVDLDRAWIAAAGRGGLCGGQASQDGQRQDNQGQHLAASHPASRHRSSSSVAAVALQAAQGQSRLTCVGMQNATLVEEDVDDRDRIGTTTIGGLHSKGAGRMQRGG
jgi:hypothetical protein